jgi:hypothetical protein
MKHNIRIEKTSLIKFRPRHSTKERRCNICNQKFHPRTVFDRYCSTCKEESDIYRFGEWLPELDEAITEKISA